MVERPMRRRERQSQRCDRETERVPKGSKMERQTETVTVKDKTKTEGSVSERQEDKSPGRQLLAAAS